jgi:hypothetical protein
MRPLLKQVPVILQPEDDNLWLVPAVEDHEKLESLVEASRR